MARDLPGEIRRGVAFIRELVPKRAIAWMARAAYNEPYAATPMQHRIVPPQASRAGSVEYRWKNGDR